MPAYLRLEVAAFLYKDLIDKVPLFHNADPEFVRAIISNLRPQVYLPDTWVIRKGEIGREMYILGKGKVEVVGEEDDWGNRPVFATLKFVCVLCVCRMPLKSAHQCQCSSGSFFGEIALLMNQPRNASIRTVEFCELYMLTAESFKQVFF